MTPFLDVHAVAQYSSLRILDSLVEGSLIGIFAAVLLRSARRQTAGTRFAIWFSALVAIALLPVLGTSLSSKISGGVASHAAITVPDSWALYLFVAWAMLAAWFLLGIGRAVWHLHVLRRNCVPIDCANTQALFRDALDRSGIRRRVAICTSDRVRVPTAIGLLKPAIVLPRWVIEELTADEIRQVLLHELAHLRRWDDWTNLAQQFVKALFFFHPAVWWIEKKAALEREMACDDAVLAETESPRAYAECLTHLAERSFIQRSVALAQAAIGRIRQTSARVAQILDVNRPKAQPRSWKPAVSLVAGFAVACALGVSQAPTMIAFREPASAPLASLLASSEPANAFVVRPAGAPAAMAPSSPHALPVIPARLKISPAHRNPALRQNRTALGYAASQPSTPPVHLARSTAVAVPYTETVYLVVQGQDQDQQGYQIQMWRVTLLRYVDHPATTTAPKKQT
ncbi:MAG TPA: M56 family metallopeptidase [Candidatus Acidoferrales bacterium]|nr:M56 family metallopeptidase [Candidatus Acidoferrales bacterium]